MPSFIASTVLSSPRVHYPEGTLLVSDDHELDNAHWVEILRVARTALNNLNTSIRKGDVNHPSLLEERCAAVDRIQIARYVLRRRGVPYA